MALSTSVAVTVVDDAPFELPAGDDADDGPLFARTLKRSIRM